MHSLRTYLLQALADPAARDAAGPEALVSAENPCHQAIFMNHGPSAVTPLDPELIEVGDAIGQRAQRRDPPIWRPLRRLRVAVDATPEWRLCRAGSVYRSVLSQAGTPIRDATMRKIASGLPPADHNDQLLGHGPERSRPHSQTHAP
jgi:hypothetical protein